VTARPATRVERAARATRRGAVLVTGSKPAWWQRRRVARAARDPRRPDDHRWLAPPDVGGPKVRVGIAWFALEVWAVWREPLMVACCFGAIAAVAAMQASAAWRPVHGRSDGPAAALVALSLPVAALVGLPGVAAAVGAGVVLAVGVGALDATGAAGRVQTATILKVGLVCGVAAASPVALTQMAGWQAGLLLIAVVAVYDSGDFLVGSAASNRWEGPLAGVIGVVVVTFVASVLEPEPFSAGQVWVLGVAAAVAAPCGPAVASAALPRAGAFAPALRRVDSLLVVGPALVVLAGFLS